MKKLLLLLAFLTVTTAFAQQNDTFAKNFLPKTLRMDYYHCGDNANEHIFLKEFISEPYWAGGRVNLIQDKDYGNHILKVYDKASGELLFSRGFCSLFNEWQSTPEALTVQKSYPEAVVMPFPKNKVRIELSSRDRMNRWVKRAEIDFDPSSYFIRPSSYNDEVFDVVYSGHYDTKVDVVFLSEGYTDRAKFEDDCAKFASSLFEYEPFRSRKADFNIRGVWRPSVDRGVSVPGEYVWKNTSLSSNYYTFDSERYLTVADFQGVRDMAGNVPYDLVYILADTKKYGGGGIYNFYGISAAGDPSFGGKVFVHEFAHLFAGMGDEYVGTTAYDGLYNKNCEPWEENLTTLVDFDKKFWKSMLSKDTKIPTLIDKKNADKLGVYQGGGYQKEGVYRPMIDCIMSGYVSNEFCPVCAQTLDQMIDFHTNKTNLNTY